MIFDLKSPVKRKDAIERFKYLLDKNSKVEILEKKKNRSYSQNNYLHLILGWFSLAYGDTIEEIKQEIFKKVVNPDIFKTEFVNHISGEYRTAWKSTAKLDSGELSAAIEKFRNYSSKEFGLYLPEPSDINHLDEIKNELEKHSNKIYL